MRRGAALAVAVVLIAIGAWLLSSDSGDETETASPSAPAPSSPDARPSGAKTSALDDDGIATNPLEARRLRADAMDSGSASDGGANDTDVKTGMLNDLARGQLQAWLRDNAETAAKRVDEYCKATKGLVSEQDEQPPARARDAALYLAGRSDWEGGHVGLLHLTPAITERMGNPPGAWRGAGPELYAGLDFGWMKELLAFDTWSIATASPLRDQAELKNYAEADLPNYVTLQSWAKLRLLKGFHENDVANASLEVRHLAELIGTNGVLVGDMIRISMFGIERTFFEEKGISIPPAMTQSEALRRRHAGFAAMDFMLPGVDSATREKAMKCIPNRCSALMEGLGRASALRSVIPAAEEQLKWLRDQKPCDPALVELTMKSKPMNPMELLDTLGERSLENSMNSLMDAGVK